MMIGTHGSKQLCSNCNNRFYDMGKQPAICPKCEFVTVMRVKPPTTSLAESKAARRLSSLRRLAAKRNYNAGKRE